MVNKGGRQGCRFGGKIFNFGYAEALGRVSEILVSEGIATTFSSLLRAGGFTES